MKIRLSVIAAFTFMLLANSAQAASAEKSITKLKDVPKQVKSILSDCSEVTEHKEDWLNGKNLFLIDLGDGKKLWFSSCELSASQVFSAFIVETPEDFRRVHFDQYIDGKIQYPRDNIPGAWWDAKSNTVNGRASGGCAGYSGMRWIWKWTGETFRLIEQAESDECIGPDKWPVVYRGK